MVNQEYYNLGTAPSVIRQLFAYGLEQAAKVGPEKVYDYSLGNPSIPAPKKVNESIKKIVDETDSIKLHGYAKDLSNRFGLDVKGSELFFTCGAAPALVSIIKALTVNSDSEIMVVAPFFPEYRPFITANGAKMVMVPADTEAFQIHLDEVEKRITANTQGIIINSPNNPSGAVYSKETIRKLAALLTKKSEENGTPIFILADEPYREIAYDGVEVPYVTKYYANTLVCYSYSKSLSLPGERIGYVLVPDEVDDARTIYAAVCGAGRALGFVCAPSLIQHVIAKCAGQVSDLSVYKKNRDLLYDSLTAYGFTCVHPDGAFYLFMKTPEPDAYAFCEKAKKHELLLVPGDDFGAPGFVRIAYCVTTAQIARALPAFKELAGEYFG